MNNAMRRLHPARDREGARTRPGEVDEPPQLPPSMVGTARRIHQSQPFARRGTARLALFHREFGGMGVSGGRSRVRPRRSTQRQLASPCEDRDLRRHPHRGRARGGHPALRAGQAAHRAAARRDGRLASSRAGGLPGAAPTPRSSARRAGSRWGARACARARPCRSTGVPPGTASSRPRCGRERPR